MQTEHTDPTGSTGSTDSVGPGTRLADRYLLLERRLDGDGTAYWRAVDELLARPVGVRTVPAGSARARAVVEAARSAVLVDDPRFLRVLDVSEDAGTVYVVHEWVDADTLAELLRRDGPLPPGEAWRVLTDVAEAVAVAHARGLPHRALTPGAVLRTPAGAVKVAGLAVDAAAAGLPASSREEAAADDTRALGALLYAALTARWPDGPAHGLPAAPEEHGRVCSPRQVRAGVPPALDAVTDRALLRGIRGREEPLQRPAELAAALAGLAAVTEEPQPQPAEPEPSPWPRRTARTARLLVACLLVGGLALTGGQIVRAARDDSPAPGPRVRPTPATPSPTDSADVGTVPVRSVRDFDPEGDGREDRADTESAVDGNLRTAWRTDAYRSRELGRLKSGVGLVLDLGAPQRVRSVEVTLRGRGTDIELRTATAAGSTADDFTAVAQVEGAGREARLEPKAPVTARYLLLWLTALPSDDERPGDYRGAIAEVVVRR